MPNFAALSLIDFAEKLKEWLDACENQDINNQSTVDRVLLTSADFINAEKNLIRIGKDLTKVAEDTEEELTAYSPSELIAVLFARNISGLIEDGIAQSAIRLLVSKVGLHILE